MYCPWGKVARWYDTPILNFTAYCQIPLEINCVSIKLPSTVLDDLDLCQHLDL